LGQQQQQQPPVTHWNLGVFHGLVLADKTGFGCAVLTTT
jgi:hypothetical protein